MKTTKSLTWKSLASALVLGAVLTVTACGGAETTGPGTAPAVETPTASATPTPTLENGAKPGGPVAKDGTPLTGTHGLKVKGPAENEHGQYLQITISDDDPALKYDPNIVTPQISSKFTAEEIADAQKFAMTFFVEEGLDSTLNNGSNYEEWMQRELDNFVPRLQPEIKNALNSDMEFIHLRNWGKGEKYNFHYDKDSTRVLGYKVEPVGVTQSMNPVNSESMLFVYNYEVSSVQTNLAGAIYPAGLKGEGKIGVEKDPANPGKWLISELWIKYDAFVATENLNP